MIGWPSVRSLSTVISLVFSGFGLVSLDQNPSPTPGYNLYAILTTQHKMRMGRHMHICVCVRVLVCVCVRVCLCFSASLSACMCVC